MYVRTYVCMYVCMCVYVCMHACMFVVCMLYVCMYVCLHCFYVKTVVHAFVILMLYHICLCETDVVLCSDNQLIPILWSV